VSHNFMF